MSVCHDAGPPLANPRSRLADLAKALLVGGGREPGDIALARHRTRALGSCLVFIRSILFRIMRVVEIVESAAHVCLLLAALPPGKGLPAAKLAEFHGLSATSVAKQLQQLSAAGIVVGTKGRSGGYRLARPARNITLLEIVQAVDGDLDGFRCHEIRQQGPCAGKAGNYRTPCAIAGAMHQAEAAWRASLAKTRLSDLGRSVSKHLPEKLTASSRTWLEGAMR